MTNFSLKRTLSALAIAATAAGLAPLAAHASTPLRGFLFGIPSSTMTKGDWAAFNTAAVKLLDQMPSTVGQSQDWQGPSGAHGLVTIERIFANHDMPCRDVQAQFNGKHQARTLKYKIAVCRDAQGEWRLGS